MYKLTFYLTIGQYCIQNITSLSDSWLARQKQLMITFTNSLDRTSFLIWIKIVCQSDNVPERIFFEKVNFENNQQTTKKQGAQSLSSRVLYSRCCIVSLSKNINPSLVMVQPRKTPPFITERLLIGCKESNQTKLQRNLQSYPAYKVLI